MKLAVLHLSDIHFHGDDDAVFHRSTEIAESVFPAVRQSNACLIAITGDIAYGGASEEYAAAQKFITTIRDCLASETDASVHIIMVPGNHDCVLIPEDEVREIVIDKITAKPSEAEKPALVETCVSIQANFFEFQRTTENLSPVFEAPLWREYQIEIDGVKVRISGLNVAWMSRLPEKPGTLVFPLQQFEEQLTAQADLRLALLHQPYNWHQQRSYHELKTSLQRNSDAVLSGHEHRGNSGVIVDERSGPSLYFEAGALQPHHGEGTPAYAVYRFDTTAGTVVVDRFELELAGIRPVEESAVHELPSRTEKHAQYLDFTSEWATDLNSPGGYFTHPEKAEIVMNDLFVYPDLNDVEESQPTRLAEKSAETLVPELQVGAKVLLLGDERAGKTTLIFTYIRRLNDLGFAAVYVKASEFSKIRAVDDVGPRLDRLIGGQYQRAETVKRLPRSKRVLFIDDVDRLKSGLGAIQHVLEYAERNFASVILTANPSFEIASLASTEAASQLGTYKKFQILKFGKKLRHRLIKKWCSLGPLGSLQELDLKIDTAESLVNTVIGKNLVPEQPIYLLILLQSADQNQAGELQNSSFSHYYQYLITRSLYQVNVKTQELDEYQNYLSHLAWYLQERGTKEIDLPEFRRFNEGFSRIFTSVDFDRRLHLLVEARILTRRGDFYSFAYPYVYFFFIGRYLASKVHTDQEVKTWVLDACQKLYIRDKANAVLFLTHHDNNPWVITQIAEVMRKCFHDKAPMELNGDADSINTLVTKTSALVIEAPNVARNQEESRAFSDSVALHSDEPELHPDDPNKDLAFLARWNLLMKTAQILGQILKNYYGSLEKPFKADLIGEVFDGPLRALRIFLEEVERDMDGLVADVRNLIADSMPGLNVAEQKQAAHKTTFQILSWLGNQTIAAAAQFVASDKLREDISAKVAENPTVAYRLIGLATRLLRPGQLPLDEISKMAKELEGNHYAFGILQSLGVHHLYLFHTDAAHKQSLCKSLGISLNEVKAIEAKKRDTRMLARS